MSCLPVTLSNSDDCNLLSYFRDFFLPYSTITKLVEFEQFMNICVTSGIRIIVQTQGNIVKPLVNEILKQTNLGPPLSAVKIISKNKGKDGNTYVALNQSIYFDQDGNFLSRDDFGEKSGLIYISHMIPFHFKYL